MSAEAKPEKVRNYVSNMDMDVQLWFWARRHTKVLNMLFYDPEAAPDKTPLLRQMQIYAYNADDFDSLSAALREKRIIAAMAVFFQVGTACIDWPSASPRCFRDNVFRTDVKGNAAAEARL